MTEASASVCLVLATVLDGPTKRPSDKPTNQPIDCLNDQSTYCLND